MRRKFWPALRRIMQVLALGVLLSIAAALIAGWKAFGHRPSGDALARVRHSSHWQDGHFVNPEPLVNDLWKTLVGMTHVSENVSPASPPPTVALSSTSFASPPSSGLRVTWFGHSSTLVELDGKRVLTDPIWSERASPFEALGPARWTRPPLLLEELPHIDAVVVSHDHYDHLDMGTMIAMREWDTVFIVPLGVGAHLAYWGIAPERIRELDWWESTKVGALEIFCTPARHASGRHLLDKDATLWAGYALVGPAHRVYYSGDTGLFSAMNDIGDRLGPFDLTMIETGQYNAAWPDWHIGPEQAVMAHQMVRGRMMLPVHWDLFGLAYHGWTEPIERTRVAAASAGVALLMPMPGQSIEPARAPAFTQWWPKMPWQTASEAPIVSGGLLSRTKAATP